MSNLTGNSSNNTILGTANNDSIAGLGGNDRLEGLGGNDTLNGGTGADLLIGGAGNDLYIIDRITEIDKATLDVGTDTVQSSVTYTLGAQQEHLTLTGAAALNGTGNTKANILLGNNGANKLSGLGGNDTLTGNNGNDTLTGAAGNDTASGGAGNDTLNGGTGNDRLLGGGGNDTLIFDALDTRGVNGGGDTDTLKVNGATTADLATLNSGTAKFTNIEIIDLNASGAQTLLLDAATVAGLSSTTDELIIRGTAEDTVTAGSGWSFAGLTAASGQTYQVFSQGAASLRIDASIGHDLDTSALSLALLNGGTGFRLDGIDAGDSSGFSLSSAGDVNGDGFADLIIGAPFADPSGTSSGASYVVFGGSSFASELDLSALNGTNGFRVNGIDAYDRSGNSVSSAGDVNGGRIC